MASLDVLNPLVGHGEDADAVVLVAAAGARVRAARLLENDVFALGDHPGDIEAYRSGLVVRQRSR